MKKLYQIIILITANEYSIDWTSYQFDTADVNAHHFNETHIELTILRISLHINL